MAKYPIRQMLDHKREPFFPFVTSDAVFINETDQTLTEFVLAFLNSVEEDLNLKIEDGTFTGEQGPQGPEGPQGEQGVQGNSGVYMGSVAPTDPSIAVWIDTSDETTVAAAEEASF